MAAISVQPYCAIPWPPRSPPPSPQTLLHFRRDTQAELEMGAAHAMKRIPLIKFPQRHPKPSGSSRFWPSSSFSYLGFLFHLRLMIVLFFCFFFRSFSLQWIYLFDIEFSIYSFSIGCVNFTARLFNLERLSRNQRVSVSLERKKIREKMEQENVNVIAIIP